jgi:hypothetical protein
MQVIPECLRAFDAGHADGEGAGLAVHHSLIPYFSLLLAAVAAELVAGVERVPLEMLEGEHVAQDVVLGADAAGGAELEAAVALRAAKVAEFALELESAGFACRGAFASFRQDPQVLILMC